MVAEVRFVVLSRMVAHWCSLLQKAMAAEMCLIMSMTLSMKATETNFVMSVTETADMDLAVSSREAVETGFVMLGMKVEISLVVSEYGCHRTVTTIKDSSLLMSPSIALSLSKGTGRCWHAAVGGCCRTVDGRCRAH
jgi:hypothetical protein